MLRVENLEYTYNKSKFKLKNINFSLEDGYLMCLIGKNGAGKTTLLQGIYGVLQLQAGAVIYNGIKVVAGAVHSNGAKVEAGESSGQKQGKIPAKTLASYHNEVAYVGIVKWFLQDKTIEETVDTLKVLYQNFDEMEYERLCQYFGLSKEDEKKKYIELSAGQKMLFQIAFAMARHPRLLLMDEPFANLDPIIKVDLAQLFQEKLQKENMQIIVSTHLVDDITDVVDYIGVIQNGEMVEFGDRETIFQGKDVEDLKEYIMKDLTREGAK